jgi:2-amino-4-hydroxy-6-hydroxymethyldihydropteridine diphosphokinase
MGRVFVAVGSNIEPDSNVSRALRKIKGEVGVRAVSTFYRTPALERPQDPPFANGVIEVGDSLSAPELKKRLRAIEDALGGARSADPYGPRTIDLDLLLYGDVVSDAPELTLPHPEIHERRFVALPLLELAPELRLPDSGLPLRAVADSLPAYPMEPLPGLTRQLQTEVQDGS